MAPEYRQSAASAPAPKTSQPTTSPASSIREVIKSASSLKERRKADELIRNEDTREWAQNREFYKGNQYVFWNRVLNTLESLPVQDGEKPRYKVRLKQNKIRKGVHRWIAQMTKNKPVIFATPDSSSDRDMKAAEAAESLFEHEWRDQNLTGKLQRGLMFAALSQGYLEVTYDPFAGKQTRHIVQPGTKQPLDGPLAELLLEEIQKQSEQTGIAYDKLESRVVKYTQEGSISVKAVPGENVVIDPAAEDFDSAAYCFITHNLTPDEIEARWRQKVTPDAVPVSSQPALLYQKQTDKRPKTVRRVYCGYFKPTPYLKKGRYVIWIEDPDLILDEGDWQLPFNQLPLIKLPGHESTEGPLDLPPTTEARPLQQELNRTISQIVEHKDLTLRPQMIAPVGSLRQRLTAEPGLVIEYQPIAGLAPEWRPIPGLPAYVFDHMQQTVQRIDEIYNTLPNQRDQMPARIDSGGAIDLIQETASDDMLPPIRRLEEAMTQLGYMIACLAQKFYSEPRLLQIKGANGSMATRRFLAADLKGGFSFHAEAGSGLPRTRAGKQARIEFLLQNHLIDQTTALKYLDMADMGGVIARIEADEDMALREHDKLIQGQPISQVMVMQAMQAASDPNADPDGDGLPDKIYNPRYYLQWAQSSVEQAAVAPLEWENAEVHERVHREFMSTEEFEDLPPETQERFIQHYTATYQRLVNLRLMSPAEAPKINLRLQGATSAAVQGAILRKSGLQVTDDQVAMPPLDTWVTTDTAEPAQQASGDVQVDPAVQQATQLQQLSQAADKHEVDMAKAQHENALAGAKVVQAGQQLAQSHDTHAQAQQHAEQTHQAKLKAMLQKPKPAPTQAQ